MRVAEIARLVNGALAGDGRHDIRGIANLEAAGPQDLAFAQGQSDLARAARSCAGCILLPTMTSLPDRTTISVNQPKLAFILAAEALLPQVAFPPGVHPTAIVSPGVQLPPDVSVGPHVVIEEAVKIGPGTRLAHGVYLGERVEVGSRCILHPHVAVYAGACIGNRVVLHAGVVIGGDGFGYVLSEGRHHKFPQVGGVVIEDDVEIGCNSTVDRGSLGTTLIGAGTKIDNLVQVGHNVSIGRHCTIVAQTGISGSSQIGDYVVFGGQAGIGDHVRIEDGAVIGGQAGILPGKIIRRGSVVWGTPARPLADFKRQFAMLGRLPALAQRVKQLAGRSEPSGGTK